MESRAVMSKQCVTNTVPWQNCSWAMKNEGYQERFLWDHRQRTHVQAGVFAVSLPTQCSGLFSMRLFWGTRNSLCIWYDAISQSLDTDIGSHYLPSLLGPSSSVVLNLEVTTSQFRWNVLVLDAASLTPFGLIANNTNTNNMFNVRHAIWNI